MDIGKICSRNVITVRELDELTLAAQLMREKHIGYLIVVRPGIDDRTAPAPAYRVGRKEHPGSLRADEPLYDNADRDPALVDPALSAVGHGSIAPQRGPAAPHRVDDLDHADDVQKAILLSRKACPGQVLRSGRGADRDRRRGPAQRIVGE